MLRRIAEEETREVPMNEMIADMIEDWRFDNREKELELSEPDFKEAYYDYCMRHGNTFIPSGPDIRQDNQQHDTDDNDIIRLMQEGYQDENKDLMKQKKLEFYYKWSQKYIRRLESDIARVKKYNDRLLEKNRNLRSENAELYDECQYLKQKTKKLKKKLTEAKQNLNQYRKVVWKNIKNGKWTNKKAHKLIKKRNMDDFVNLL